MNHLTIGRFPPLSYACQEAVNTLCTNISFAGRDIKKIMITSSHASEGKSFLTMNMMRTMASFGKKVVLVEADLRRNSISSRFDLQIEAPVDAGLAHFLSGMAEVKDVIYRTDIPGAFIVPAGRNVSNPMRLLNSQHFNELLDYLSAIVDYVLVDAPPVATVIDGAEIAKSCDGTVLVVAYNAVHRQELIEAKEQLEQTGCPILGAVLNQVQLDGYLNKKYYKYDSEYISGYKKKGAKKGKHLAAKK